MTSPRAPGRALVGASSDAHQRWRALALLSLGGIALALSFIAAYYETIGKLVAHWSSNDMYSYGFLVPAISGYLIWLRRHRLRHVPIGPGFALGLPVLSAGLGLLVVGRVSAINLVEQLSLPITICGLAILVLGRPMAQSLTFPLVYLFTMIPFWDVFTGRLHLPFQLYSAAMGVGALRLLNIPVLHQGVLIDLPTVTLEVAEVCSGVNNLVAILCIGVPLTHFYVRRWPKRIVVMIAAALIALISNGVRVATVCLFAYYGIRGADGDIHGPFSLMRSLAISGVGFFALFWLIAKFADRREQLEISHPQAEGNANRFSPTVPIAAAVALAVALLTVADGFERWRPVRPTPLKSALVGFPVAIGPWEPHTDRALDRELSSLDFDSKLVRDYVGPDGSEVSLLLGYFEHQTQSRELAGSGFFNQLGVLRAGTHRLPVGAVRDGVVSNAHGRAYLLYAYVLDGDVIATDYQVKWRTLRNILAERRSNGGIVVVAARIGDSESLDVVRSRYRDFLDRALPPAVAFLSGQH